MCIVCDIRALNPSPEVMAKVETMAEAFGELMDCIQTKLQADEKSFTEAEQAIMWPAFELLQTRQPTLADQLAQMGVNVHFVSVNEGESLQDAINRGMGEVAAKESEGKTKH